MATRKNLYLILRLNKSSFTSVKGKPEMIVGTKNYHKE